SVDAKQSVLHGDAKAHGARCQSHHFTKSDIDLGEIAAQDRLSVFHLVVRFAWLACLEARHADAITTLGQPQTYLVGALPRRIGNRNLVADLASQVSRIFRSETCTRFDLFFDRRHAENRVAATLNR